MFALILYQSIYFTNNNGIDYRNNFNYQGDNKVLVYNTDKKPLDKAVLDKIEGDKVYNFFYQITGLNSIIDLENGSLWHSTLSDISYYERTVDDLTLDYGTLPTDKNDVVLLLPWNSIDLESYVNSTINIQIDGNNTVEFNITGVAYRDDVKSFTFTKCDRMENLFVSAPYLKLQATQDNTNYAVNINFDAEETYISVPSERGDFTFSVDPSYNKSFDIYDINVSDLYEVRKDDNATSVTLNYSLDDKINQDTIYEAVIYGNIDKITSELRSAGYNYIIPSKTDNRTQLDFFMNNLTTYITMVLASLSLVIVYIVTYVILSKIYQSKKKDYTILRTLGVTKSDMKHIVSNEIMIQTIIISIISYLIIFILGKAFKADLEVFNQITFFSTCLYFLVMCIFGYFIARRFNRKLFKYSVNTTFKSEVAKND